MIRQLVASYVLLVVAALLGLTVPVTITLTNRVYADVETLARREAQTAALLLAADDAPSRQNLARLSAAYQIQTPAKMDALSAGRAAINPMPLPAAVDDEAFTAALAGQEYLRWEQAPALGADGMVIAVPATAADGTVLGAVRISYPLAPIRERLWQIWGLGAVLAGVVLIVAAVVGALLARRLTRPLRQLNDMASRLRDGDLTARAEETGPPETRTLASTLNTATETIDTLIGSQRAFIGDASHQLRTPLTALRLSLDNIADGVDDPYLREDVEHATAEVVRMSRLVNGLLALARMEATVSSPEPVRIVDVVADRFDAWRAAAEGSGVRLDHDIADQKLCALASPGHLEQVLDNVLSNALEVSPDRGTVTVRTHRDAGKAVIEVIDQGPGLPAADRHRAFDRFWRGPGLTGRSGSGLGLAIVKQLVSDDGGTVTLAEADTGGLCVRIMLRLA